MTIIRVIPSLVTVVEWQVPEVLLPPILNPVTVGS